MVKKQALQMEKLKQMASLRALILSPKMVRQASRKLESPRSFKSFSIRSNSRTGGQESPSIFLNQYLVNQQAKFIASPQGSTEAFVSNTFADAAGGQVISEDLPIVIQPKQLVMSPRIAVKIKRGSDTEVTGDNGS